MLDPKSVEKAQEHLKAFFSTDEGKNTLAAIEVLSAQASQGVPPEHLAPYLLGRLQLVHQLNLLSINFN